MNVMEQRRHNEAIENQAKIESLEAQLAEKDAEIADQKIKYQDLAKSFDELCNDIWGIIYPKATDWDYPEQVFRHIRDYVAEIQEGRRLQSNTKDALFEHSERLEKANGELKAEHERLSTRLEHFYSNTLELFVTPCENHSGKNTPPFEDFQTLLGGRCHWCDVLEVERLKKVPEEILAEMRLNVTTFSNDNGQLESALEWSTIKEIFDKFAQEPSDN